MKKHLLTALAIPIFLVTLITPLTAMEEGVFASGREWVRQMSPKEKMMSLLPPMALYHKFGIRFQKTVLEYIDTMDAELAVNPLLEKEDVANIFASTVYALEPENRLPLERMSSVFGILQKRDPENPYPSIPISEETVLAE